MRISVLPFTAFTAFTRPSGPHSRWPSAVIVVASLLLAQSASADPLRRFADAPPVWVDPDANDLDEPPEEYWSGLVWDGADQTAFIPLHEILRLDLPGPAANINAWDEVPNSSWWTNRIGVRDLTPEQVARGACTDGLLDSSSGDKWTVKAAKPNGANPGFIIKADDGRYYLLKMDGHVKPERATTADVFGSKLYWAAGYHVPCNLVVFFEPDIFVIDPEAEAEDEEGNDIAMEQHHVDAVLDKAVRAPDGRLRASASLFIDGKPLGPWTYQGVRRDDPNDVIRHEDRREIRANRLLSAWTNHFDAREQNTLSAWVEEDGRGYVRHYYIDWGDTLGSSWPWVPDTFSRRFGYSYYFDLQHIAEDFLYLGAIERPWETVTTDPEVPILGWYDVEHFEPDEWKAGYRNPAFARMDDGDGAWMARIMARMSDEHVAAMLGEGHLSNSNYEARVLEVLLERRDLILERWLRSRSPLADFTLLPDGEGTRVCMNDLASSTGLIYGSTVEARMHFGRFDVPAWTGPVEEAAAGVGFSHCVRISGDGIGTALSAGDDPYAVLDLVVHPTSGEPLPPARLHLYDHGSEGFDLVGIERPAHDSPPGNK